MNGTNGFHAGPSSALASSSKTIVHSPRRRRGSLGSGTSSTPAGITLKSKPKKQVSTTSRVAIPDPWCSFCQQADISKASGEHEALLSCASCGSSGHPSCLKMVPELVEACRTYDWECMECKICEICRQPPDDTRTDLMFCDICDKAWHGLCLDPPIADPPEGVWKCPNCEKGLPIATKKSKPRVSWSNQNSGFQPSSAIRKLAHRLAPMKTGSPLANNMNNVEADVIQLDAHTPHKRKLGRPPKNRTLTQDLLQTPQSAAALANSRQSARKGKAPARYTDDEGSDQEDGVRIPGQQKSHKRRRIADDDDGGSSQPVQGPPYGGLLHGTAADPGDRIPQPDDRRLFETARMKAELRLSAIGLDLDESYFAESPRLQHRPATQPARRGRPPGRPSLKLARHDIIMADPNASLPGTPMTAALPEGAYSNIKRIQFGDFRIETWYQAPYPEEFARLPNCTLYLCEFCLKYMKTAFQADRHRKKCRMRHPPGDEIYQDENVSIFEIDGRKHKIYCQNLCLLSKLFLDHKTLFYDVEPFLFYVMVERCDTYGCQFIGYFSKEKRSPTNNVSCIMTLPVRAKKGYGSFLIEFSYLLSKREGRTGTPEKPLSDLGLLSYRSYWKLHIFQYLLSVPQGRHVTMQEISSNTSITIEDIYYILRSEHMIWVPALGHRSDPKKPGYTRAFSFPSLRSDGTVVADDRDHQVPSDYEIIVDRPVLESHVSKWKSKGHIVVQPDRLKWTPFLVTNTIDTQPHSTGHHTTESNEREQLAHLIYDPQEPGKIIMVDTHGIQIEQSHEQTGLDTEPEQHGTPLDTEDADADPPALAHSTTEQDVANGLLSLRSSPLQPLKSPPKAIEPPKRRKTAAVIIESEPELDGMVSSSGESTHSDFSTSLQSPPRIATSRSARARAVRARPPRRRSSRVIRSDSEDSDGGPVSDSDVLDGDANVDADGEEDDVADDDGHLAW